MLVHPYAEDYWNAIKDPSTPSAEFHRKHYANMPYQGFKPLFEDRLRDWRADDWAKSFHDAGAKYVVMVAKYHDGYCLWPTTIRNPHEPNWFSARDLVGELGEAVRRQGMRFGLYYSGGVDWTFQRRISRTLGDYVWSTPGGDYPAYAEAQVRELIERYKPDILWNDICWPTDEQTLFCLFADYYNTVPDGVVNDRWQPTTLANRFMRLKPARAAFDLLMRTTLKLQPDILSNLKPTPIAHSDFTTPEYTQYPDIQMKKWEMTRGIGNSFGHNQNEHGDDYASFKTLFTEFVDAVAKNGNLLLNVGPSGGEGQIPSEQMNRILQFGEWLSQNGKAVFETRPWAHSEATTDAGDPTRFTKKDTTLNLIILGSPSGERIRIKNLSICGTAHLLTDDRPVKLEPDGHDTVIVFHEPLTGAFAPVITIRAAAGKL
jgi:alpha-L-fucosidase